MTRPEEEVGSLLVERGETLAIAESLTGGLVASMITNVPGSSRYLLEGVVSYANGSKMATLGVKEATLIAHGAVSEEVAIEMAIGVRQRAGSDWGVSTTGIAGPTGATPEKPLGLVYVGVAGPRGARAVRHVFDGDRLAVKRASAEAALLHLAEELRGPAGP
jgi:PncC family amidohydrolase